MNELANQWYPLGSLLVQAGFLIAGVWFAGKFLRGVRASQEQMAALLRLSLLGGRNDGAEQEATTHRATPYLLDGWPAATPTAAATETESVPRKRRFAGAWSGLVGWLETPMVSSGISPWRRMVRWLQAPAGS